MADIKRIVIKEIKKTGDERYGWMETSIVQWESDGKKMGGLSLEKRSIYIQNGQLKTGKAKGFNAEEFKFLIENSLDIIELMEGKIAPDKVSFDETKTDPVAPPSTNKTPEWAI